MTSLTKIIGVDWLQRLQADNDVIEAAVDTGSGLISCATDAQTITGTSAILAVTPASLMAALAALTFPIGTAAAILSSSAGIGYKTGAGGTVVQATSRATGVTLNKICGTITMFSAAQDTDVAVTFTLTNSLIAAGDFILIEHISATNGGGWQFSVVAGAGSATITIRNVTAASITEATPLRFTIIKGVTA